MLRYDISKKKALGMFLFDASIIIVNYNTQRPLAQMHQFLI